MFNKYKVAACAALAVSQPVQAIWLDTSDTESIKATAAQIAGDAMRTYYTQANIQGIGQLPKPYYWWEAGSFFGSMVCYWAYTGDDSLNDITGYAILSQIASTKDFMMLDQTYDLGNDDQVVWALTAMEAAEHNFPVPAANKSSFGDDIWLTVAKNAYTDISKRWDTTTCNGGLRWQIFSQNSGWTYKSAISNAGLFQLAARLARYTGDPDGSYQKTAEMVYDWMYSTGIVADYQDQGKMVFDGATVLTDCKEVDKHRWTYNAGAMYLGAEMLASLSKDMAGKWGPISTDLFRGMQNTFLNDQTYPGTMFELNCEPYGTCNNDQDVFKGLGLRWMNKVRVVSPAAYTNALILEYSKISGNRAAGQCTGGATKTLCGSKWIAYGFQGTSGAGQQTSALEAVQGILVENAPLAKAGSSSKRSVPAVPQRRSIFSARDYMEMTVERRLALAN